MNVENITPISTSETIYICDAHKVEEPIQIVIHPQIIMEEQIVLQHTQDTDEYTSCCCSNNCCCIIIITLLCSIIIALVCSIGQN